MESRSKQWLRMAIRADGSTIRPLDLKFNIRFKDLDVASEGQNSVTLKAVWWPI